MVLQCPVPKVRLPVDGSGHSKRAVQFAGCLGASLGKSLVGLILLHVTAGDYLDSHIEEKIKPFLDEGEKILKDLGTMVEIEKLVVSGDPAREIIRIAHEGKFSTIIMARRALSELKAHVSRITLLRVINLSLYLKRIREGIDPEEESKRILDEAKEVFLRAGIPERFITTRIKVGKKPAEEIIKEAEEGQYNLVIMGRKGRSALEDLIMGGVSSTVLQRCQNPTVAIVSSG